MSSKDLFMERNWKYDLTLKFKPCWKIETSGSIHIKKHLDAALRYDWIVHNNLDFRPFFWLINNYELRIKSSRFNTK
jgi:hypothetical protein